MFVVVCFWRCDFVFVCSVQCVCIDGDSGECVRVCVRENVFDVMCVCLAAMVWRVVR